MVYKFNNYENLKSLEIEENYWNSISITIKDSDNNNQSIIINTNQLYDLIGCLHSLKGKLDKYKKEGKNG